MLLQIYSFLLYSTIISAANIVVGVDLGTEYIKAALVKPGVPLEIVLTKDSKRKEAAAVAFKPLQSRSTDPDVYPERAYGGDALALSARFPVDVYSNLKPLLGLSYKDSSLVDEFKSRYPELRIAESKPRGTIEFRSESFNKAESFMVEELLGMELQNIRANAEAFAGKGSRVKDVVVTIPAFFTAEEKQAVEVAADLAGVRILAMMSDGLAIGLNYATSRTFSETKPEYHMIYDMGAGSTTATVIKFQAKTVKDVGRFNKTVQDVQVMGVGWDKTLGGDAFNQLILDDMIDKFLETQRLKTLGTTRKHVTAHGRTMAKLWKEAERMRQVLSANQETAASFEGLFYDDVNFKYKLSRNQFEEMVSAFDKRTKSPIQQALAMAKFGTSDIESVILHGGAIRTPFVQKQLEAIMGSSDKLRTNVNSDEAAALGAAFKAAAMSPSYRVKDIQAGDIAAHPVTLSWTTDDGKERTQKLFPPTSIAGIEKQVPVKSFEDFTMQLNQQIVDAAGKTRDIPVAKVQTQNLTVSVKELSSRFGCSQDDISTKFQIRVSPVNGLPEIVGGMISCDVSDASTLGGVVDDVKGFFGFGSKKGDQIPLEDGSVEDQGETTEESSTTSTSAAKTSTTKTTTSSAASKSDKPKEIKKKTETISVSFKSDPIGLPGVNAEDFVRIHERMTAFDNSDRSRKLREEALNTLEGYTYKVRDVLDDEGIIAVSTSTERDTIQSKSKDASEWLYSDGADASRNDLKARLKELRDLVEPIQKRRDEAKTRPESLETFQKALEQIEGLVAVAKGSIEKQVNASIAAAEASSAEAARSASTTIDPQATDGVEGESSTSTTTTAAADPPFPTISYNQDDVESLSKAYESAKTWFAVKSEAQKQLSKTDNPIMLTADLDAKAKQVNKVVSDLLTEKFKPKPPKPKSSKAKTSKTKKSKTSKKAATTGKEAAASSVDDAPDATPASSPEAVETSSMFNEGASTLIEAATPSIKDEL
ncbi:lumenal Hsp70 protein [Agyrium rufum]|nr:lumenal Hsp70 protein [Agyrium rufum]